MSYAGLKTQRDSMESSSDSDQPRLSQASSTQVRIEVDRLFLELNELDKVNSRIKKQLLRFATLDKSERAGVRELLQDNLRQS